MLATFVIEVVLLAYTLWRYKLDSVTRLVALILLNLAIFQAVEYMVCEGAFGFDSLIWARTGYAAITILPPLGLHLGMSLASRYDKTLLAAAYGSAAVFCYLFLFIGQGMNAPACYGNYVIFNNAPWLTTLHTIYYFVWAVAGIWFGLWQAAKTKKLHTKAALRWLVAGYAAFIIPTAAVSIIKPATLHAIPSVMCGFALVLAILLVCKVVPEYKKNFTKPRRKK